MAVVSYEVARIAAPALWLYNILAQVYGVAIASPSITDVNDENISYFSPEPIFIAIAFSSVMATQGWWLWKFVRLNPSQAGPTFENDILPYIPINLLSNACIGTWVFFWTSSRLAIADLFVLISTVSHLAYLFFYLSPVLTSKTQRPSKQPDRLTEVVISTFAALGVLDLLHNSSIAFAKDQAPGLIVDILTGVGFVGLCLLGNVVFQAGLVFDLLAFSAGQLRYGEGWGWSVLLLGCAGVCAVIVGGGSFVRFRQNSNAKYGRVAADDEGADNRIWSAGGDESP